MITLEDLSRFRLLGLLALSVIIRPGKVKSLSPSFTTSRASSSR